MLTPFEKEQIIMRFQAMPYCCYEDIEMIVDYTEEFIKKKYSPPEPPFQVVLKYFLNIFT